MFHIIRGQVAFFSQRVDGLLFLVDFTLESSDGLLCLGQVLLPTLRIAGQLLGLRFGMFLLTTNLTKRFFLRG